MCTKFLCQIPNMQYVICENTLLLSCFDKEDVCWKNAYWKMGNGKAFAGRERYVDISCQICWMVAKDNSTQLAASPELTKWSLVAESKAIKR